MCDPMSKRVFLELFHNLFMEISNLTLQLVFTSLSQFVFSHWQKCDFYLHICADLSHYLCLRNSHSIVPHCRVTGAICIWGCVPELPSTSAVRGYAHALYIPYTSHADGIYKFLFV